MTTNFTAEQRQMIEDMSKWDSLPQNVRDLLAEQIKDTTWNDLPHGTPVLVTTDYGGTKVEFIGYTSEPDSDGDVKLARRMEDGRVGERWVDVSDMTSITVLAPAADDDGDNHITVSDGFLVLRSPEQAEPLGHGGANRAYSVPQRRMMDLGSEVAGRDEAYPLLWRNGRTYGPEEAKAAYDRLQTRGPFLPAARRTTFNGVEYVLLDTKTLLDEYAAKHGSDVIGLDCDGDSKRLDPRSTSYRPWVARADGSDMYRAEVRTTGYALVHELRNQ